MFTTISLIKGCCVKLPDSQSLEFLELHSLWDALSLSINQDINLMNGVRVRMWRGSQWTTANELSSPASGLLRHPSRSFSGWCSSGTFWRKQGNKERGKRSDDESDDLKYSRYISIILLTDVVHAGSALTPLLLTLFINDALNSKVDVYFLFQLVAAWSNSGSSGECVCSNGWFSVLFHGGENFPSFNHLRINYCVDAL